MIFKTSLGRPTTLLTFIVKFGGGYEGKPSIFDDIAEDDLILAFFPCVRFEAQILLWFRGQCYSQKNYTDEQKMKKCMDLHEELHENYLLVNMLFILCIRKGLRLIVENPYSEEHYLRRYWCYKPMIIDSDRRERGDFFKKPTQYWFVNCRPENNFIFEVTNWNAIDDKDAIKRMNGKIAKKVGANNITTARSMIHPDYANRFIREHLIDMQEGDSRCTNVNVVENTTK